MDLSTFYYGGRGFTLYHAWGEYGASALQPHVHGEYLLGCQLKGLEEIEVSGKTERIIAGDVFLINPQQVHTGNARASSGVEYISIYVDRELVEQVALELGAATTSPEFTVVRATDGGMFSATMLGLLQTMRSRRGPKSGSRPALARRGGAYPLADRMDLELDEDYNMQKLVAACIGRFSNLHCPSQPSTNRVGHRKVARAVEFMRDQVAAGEFGEISLDTLAKAAGLSKFHFSREFGEAVGMSPAAYLRALRLSEACKALRRQKASIVEIALSHGFCDRANFDRAFKRYVGMTPTKYRRLGVH